jgi:hypothetical protein
MVVAAKLRHKLDKLGDPLRGFCRRPLKWLRGNLLVLLMRCLLRRLRHMRPLSLFVVLPLSWGMWVLEWTL